MRPPSQLLGPEHDYPTPVDPTTTYVICTSPRSGSNLLCDHLTSTGFLGVPTEYLELNVATAYLAARWGASDLLGYLEVLREKRTGPNGVFANKIHWRQLSILTKKILATEQAPTIDQCATTMDLVLPRAHLIHLIREDRVGQAVSLYKAFGTGQWSSYFEKRTEPPPYDFEAVLVHYRSLVWEDASWQSYFKLTGAEPLRLSYSQLVADPALAVTAVAKHVGLDAPVIDLPEPTLRRQRDGWNAETRARFEADLSSRGADPTDPASVLSLQIQSADGPPTTA
jgi:LPS sulfotransferase NodH